MRAVIIILIAILAGGCATEKSVTRWISNHEDYLKQYRDTIHTVTIQDTTIYRDTTVYISIPPDTVTVSIEVPCPDPPETYIPDTAKAENEYAEALAWLEGTRIILELRQKEIELEITLDSAIQENSKLVQENLEIKAAYIVEVEKKKVSWYHRTTSSGFWVLFALFAFWIGIRTLKK